MGRRSKFSDEIIDLVVELLARRHHQSVIRRVLREKFSIEAARTFGCVMRLARERVARSAGKPVEKLVAEAVGFYEATIGGKDVDVRVKMKAQERLDKLLGLEQLAKARRDGRLDGGMGEPDMTEAEVELGLISAARSGEGGK